MNNEVRRESSFVTKVKELFQSHPHGNQAVSVEVIKAREGNLKTKLVQMVLVKKARLVEEAIVSVNMEVPDQWLNNDYKAIMAFKPQIQNELKERLENEGIFISQVTDFTSNKLGNGLFLKYNETLIKMRKCGYDDDESIWFILTPISIDKSSDPQMPKVDPETLEMLMTR